MHAALLALLMLAAAPEVARPADAFVDSVGVNVHLHYSDTPYNDFEAVKRALLDAGIRHVRDGLSDTAWQPYYDRHNDLGRSGIHGTFIATASSDGPAGFNPRVEKITQVLGRLADSAEAVEGTNEPNIFLNKNEPADPAPGGRPDWAEQTRLHQAALYAAVKNDPRWAGLPVVGPSVIFGDQAAVGDLSAFLDFGNSHPYPGGRPQAENLAAELARQKAVSGDKPVLITETGYHNALRTTGGHLPTGEAAEAKYLPRLFLTNFDNGVPRTFDYELIDTHGDGPADPESNFGLLRHDLTPRPAYRALKNLLRLLADPAPGDAKPFEPTAADFAVEGGPDTLRRVLLQKRDGTFYLCLWNEVRSWDPQKRADLAPPAAATALVFAGPPRAVDLYRPAAGGEADKTFEPAERLALDVPDEVIVLRVR